MANSFDPLVRYFMYASTHLHVLKGISPYLYRRSKEARTSLNIKESTTSFVSGSVNGFIWSACQAYDRGTPLVIRPDDVWLAILQSIGRFCLPHTDDILLNEMFDVPRLTKEDFMSPDTLAGEMEYLVNRKCLSEERTNSLMPDFTTTLSEDVTAACVSILGTQWKDDLPTDLRFTRAGMSTVILAGQYCDWFSLLDRLKLFEDEGEEVQHFIKNTRPILRRLHYAAREPDSPTARELFSTTVRKTPPNGVDDDLVTGWITSFYHLNQQSQMRQPDIGPFGQYGGEASEHKNMAWGEEHDDILYPAVRLADIPTGISAMPVQFPGKDKAFHGIMVGGSIGIAYERNVQNVWMHRPIAGWAASCNEGNETMRKREEILRDATQEMQREWKMAKKDFGDCAKATCAIASVLSRIQRRLDKL
ncbi:hypothetical protein SNK05_009011 [Fusarium graminearum]